MFTANFTFPLSGIWKNAMLRKRWFGWAVATLLILGAGAAEPDGRIKRMLDQNNVKYKIDSNGDFEIPFSDGNTVCVNSNVEKYKQIVVREIWTYLCDVDKRDSSTLYRMLEKNGQQKLGAYSVWQDDKTGEVYALFTIKLPSDADWEELRSAILFCASQEFPDKD